MNNYNTPAHSSARPIEIELIRSMARKPLTTKQNNQLDELLRSPADSRDAFIMKPAADWLQTPNDSQDATATLFGDFWYRGELCIMFADTNVGKSILAVQIGDSLSRGEPIPGFGAASKPEKVLYFDFELSAAQFRKRYSSDVYGNYNFGPGFTRLVFNPDADGARKFASYADYLNNAIENVLVTSGARILIIDNITCLRSGTEAAASAVNLMSKLQAIKHRYGLSILVLAHTPKRNPAKPISRNDLQGSKMLINFADSAFAIGESQTSAGMRYLKQIKQRSGSQVYGYDNVCLCRMIKPYNFLHFEFTTNDAETAHLLHYTEQHRKATEDRITQLHSQGHTLRAIATEMGISYVTVFRLVKRLNR
ncbi:AAA family ATPase [Mucilaginibacter sp.]|uniref:ATP-binding protein n=1 Tax=Mucilaginibacter sp. TaxID=1882438 RepID=UPI002634E248|nr:AAA family ATPase [Mucilaginibacter sp.]MDB5029827.1 IclR-like helix-turn-helix protein [Mucilaginibacter sp.]